MKNYFLPAGFLGAGASFLGAGLTGAAICVSPFLKVFLVRKLY